MNKGTIKWYDATKGYGFIQPDDGGEDIFVHISEVEKAGYTNLNNDQTIKYELQTKHGKSSATDLQLI
jgi:CspA family cold shock protein